jgi:hypothetical protein
LTNGKLAGLTHYADIDLLGEAEKEVKKLGDLTSVLYRGHYPKIRGGGCLIAAQEKASKTSQPRRQHAAISYILNGHLIAH